ncbi:hypothetical protein [Microcoleus sp. Z1_C3]
MSIRLWGDRALGRSGFGAIGLWGDRALGRSGLPTSPPGIEIPV